MHSGMLAKLAASMAARLLSPSLRDASPVGLTLVLSSLRSASLWISERASEAEDKSASEEGENTGLPASGDS